MKCVCDFLKKVPLPGLQQKTKEKKMNDEKDLLMGGDIHRSINREGWAKYLSLITTGMHALAILFYLIFGVYLWYSLDEDPQGLAYSYFLVFVFLQTGFMYCCTFAYGRGDAVWSYKLFNITGIGIAVIGFVWGFLLNIIISISLVYNCGFDKGALSPQEDLLCENESWYFITLQIGSYVIGALLPIMSIVSHFLMYIDAEAPGFVQSSIPQLSIGSSMDSASKAHRVNIGSFKSKNTFYE